MTNDPFDVTEASVWQKGVELDPRFHAALRIDPLLNEWRLPRPSYQRWALMLTLT
ncbi:MAG: hypothetical protein WKF84_28390 [Pyrinomonadaceae bacterium]